MDEEKLSNYRHPAHGMSESEAKDIVRTIDSLLDTETMEPHVEEVFRSVRDHIECASDEFPVRPNFQIRDNGETISITNEDSDFPHIYEFRVYKRSARPAFEIKGGEMYNLEKDDIPDWVFSVVKNKTGLPIESF